jgi:hypothetical protein
MCILLQQNASDIVAEAPAFQAGVKAANLSHKHFPTPPGKPTPSRFERGSKATHLASSKMPLGVGC